MLYLKIYTTSGIKEEEINFRKLNEILSFLLESRAKEIKVGSHNFRKSEILSLNVFLRENKKESQIVFGQNIT